MAKLLLVEDDNNLREIYEARLQAEGYDIVSARDGEEALVVAKAEKPDLIISDVMMPKISGFEMLDILRNTEGLKDVKVIMLTALGQNDDQQRADRLGADRYLVKSQVTLEDIVKVAHDLLQDAPAAGTATPAEPVASTAPPPAPVEPAAEPAAAPVAEIPVAEAPAVEQTAPQTEAKEAADVEAKIENFVAGATEDATPPPAEAPTQPTTIPVADAPDPAPAVQPDPAASVQAADDQLVDDAAQSLADSVDDPTTPIKIKAAASSVQKPDAPTEDMVTPEFEASAPPQPVTNPDNVTIAHKKVIEPPNTPPKRDIEALLAEEEAKESGSVPPVVSGDNKPDGNVDPHSISL